jgi:hypothetical protein
MGNHNPDKTGTFCTRTRNQRGLLGSVLRLALLAPDIVEAILTERQSSAMTLATLMQPFPVSWQEQVATFGSASLY